MWISVGMAAVLAGSTVWFVQRSDETKTRLVFLNVGQGDCTLIQSPGFNALIDTGPKTPYFDAGERKVLPKLRIFGVRRLDAIFLSHPDSDHVGGTGAIHRAYPDAKLIISDQFQHNSSMLKALLKWRIEPQSVTWLRDSGTISAGSVGLRYLCPKVKDNENDNDGSMFLKLTAHRATAVFTGDAPIAVEDLATQNGDWKADIMKVGHHGSRTSTGQRWLSAVNPQIAVIPVGRSNRYGHPHRVVVDRLRNLRITTYRTDRDGDITFEPKNGHFVTLK